MTIDDATKLRLHLDMVREARLIFGRDHSATLWRELGLPSPAPTRRMSLRDEEEIRLGLRAPSSE